MNGIRMWKPACERAAILAEPLDDEGALLRHDDGRPGDDDHHQDREDQHRRPARPSSPSLPHSGRTRSMSPSTRSTAAALARAAACRRPACRTDHAVPRSSALPTAPGGRSSSSDRDVADQRVDRGRAPSRCSRSSSRRRNSTSEPTDSDREQQPLHPGGARQPERAEQPDQHGGNAEEEDEEAARRQHLEPEQHEAHQHPQPPRHAWAARYARGCGGSGRVAP